MDQESTRLHLLYESIASHVWLGLADEEDGIRAKRVSQNIDPEFNGPKTHADVFSMWKNAENDRWRYREGTNTIFWWYLPSEKIKNAVADFLAKRGFHNLVHRTIDHVWGSLKQPASWEIAHGTGIVPHQYQYKTIGDSVQTESLHTPGTVYLIHFAQPYFHAKHYVGWTTNLDARLDLHKHNQGAKLLSVLNDEGIDWKVSRIWHNATPNFERTIKIHWKKTPKLCPICKGLFSYEGLMSPQESEAPEKYN